MKKTSLLLLLVSTLLLSCQPISGPQVEEIVVIGGGLMGSATAWQLSHQGQSLILVEKQGEVYTAGSSLGEARIARSNNRGNDLWSYLHNQSVQEVSVLIDYLNSTNDGQVYQMEDIYTTSPVTYVGRIGIYQKLMASLVRQKVDYEIAITPEEGKNKFGVLLPDGVLIQREYNQHSGTINPHKLIDYLHKGIRKKGNQIRYNSKVMGIQLNPSTQLYEIALEHTETGGKTMLYSKKIVSAAGPYTGTLLKEIAPYFDRLISPQRVFLAFFRIKKESYQQLTNIQKRKLADYYPVINSSTGTREGSFFSMIEYYDEEELPVIKIGGHFQRSAISDLDKVWQKELTSSEIKWSETSTVRYFKLLDLPLQLADLEMVSGYSCVYSLTPSEVPLVTPVIDRDNAPNNNFIVLGGMSGVGAKGAMTYGLIGANLLTQKTKQDSMYLSAVAQLGFERLLQEVSEGQLR